MIINTFDKNKIAKLNPSDCVKFIEDFPRIGITCFSKKLIDRYVELLNGQEIAQLGSENGKIPIYKITYQGLDIALYMSRVGAPACTVSYEEITAMGLEKLIMFGTCGVLDKNISELAIIIPTAAIRDEGTSFHYLKPKNEIKINEKYKEQFKEILNNKNCSYIEGKVWTTDAPYRETDKKITKMKKKGAICVDMECSAMNAVAQFRNKDFFHFFYAADNLDNIKWEERTLSNSDKFTEKEKIIYLALELALKINKINNVMI